MEWIRSKECQEHVDNELKKQRKKFLDDLKKIRVGSDTPYGIYINTLIEKYEAI